MTAIHRPRCEAHLPCLGAHKHYIHVTQILQTVSCTEGIDYCILFRGCKFETCLFQDAQRLATGYESDVNPWDRGQFACARMRIWGSCLSRGG